MKRIRFLVLMASSLPAAIQAQSDRRFTLEQVLGAPFPDGLVAASRANVVAWVFDAKGVRNIWVASAPDYQGRQLTNYTADDGQELLDLELSPDGRTLTYIRGSGPNRRGDIPNPTSDPAGAEQALWRIATSGGAPVKLGAGSSARFSPLGDRLVFVRRGTIMSAPVSSPGEPVALAQIRSGARQLLWSPDGKRLAFVSSRQDHSLVGVLDLAAKTVRWMDPSFDLDLNPVWSPDGNEIAFTRIPAGYDPPLFGPLRAGPPWSIRIANVATGVGHEVWRATEGKGSILQEPVGPELIWSSDNRLVFAWERDGWSHLYSITPNGGPPELLTPGEGEVEYVTTTPDGRNILYNTNIGDIDRRHLFRVPAAGGAPVAVSTGTGIEWAPTPVGDGKALAFLRSDARTPAHPAILVDGTAKSLAPQTMPADFPSARLVEPEQVIFRASDGLPIHGQLFLPSGLSAGERRPALVFFHGGSRRQMLLGFHYMFYYHNSYAMNQYLASLGYVVLSVNYRSGIGYGLDFREALQFGATGAAEFNDVTGAGLYLRGRADVDPTRIGLWGGSYGGYLTAMGLAKASNLYAAGVDIHGVHDWNEGIQTFDPSYNPLEKPEAARLAWESSPLAWVDSWRSPVLLIHGDDDRNVDFRQSVRLVEALRKRGIEPERLVFPDEIHDFLTYRTWMAAYQATADFFNRHLGMR